MATSVVCTLVLASLQADEQARARDEKLVRHGVADWITAIEGRVVGQVHWDEALRKLSNPTDREWATINIAKFYYDIADVDRAYVMDRDDRLVFASAKGQVQRASNQGIRQVDMSNLVQRVREGERKLYSAAGRNTVKFIPVQASSILMIDGDLQVATASLVESDDGRAPRGQRAPVVVTLVPARGMTGWAFGDRYLLKDLTVHAGRLIAPTAERSVVDLPGADGKVVGQLSWRPQNPGRELLKTLLAPMLVMLVALAVVAYRLDRRERAAARSLKVSEMRARHLAFHDHLTGLANRTMFQDHLVQASARLRRESQAFGVLVVDLDRFTQINDNHGHPAGDRLIEVVAARITNASYSQDLVARLGADEFAILVCASNEFVLEGAARRILKALNQPVDLSSERVFTSASIGGALVTTVHADPSEGLRQAEVALHAAKAAGRRQYCAFHSDMDQGQKSRRRLEADLRHALGNEQLKMAYQPQVDSKGVIFGVEALLRWSHPARGPVSPAEFISVAEECGVIGELGEFTLRQAFTDSRKWPSLKVAVNVSALQLRNADFVTRVREIIDQTGANPSQIELEITESVLLADDEDTLATLNALRGLGFSIALDDFGTGYSSLSYLRKYPVDKIKIDRSFITNLGIDRQSEEVVSAIIKLARAMNLSVIAEGVETDVQRLGLRRAGCGDFQGFLFSKAEPADAISQMLATPPRLDSLGPDRRIVAT